MEYAAVVKRFGRGYTAHAPDLPGGIVAGPTDKEELELMRGALDLHLQGLADAGQPIPQPAAVVKYVAVKKVA
jgi:predicted RNase H-like HicB family nuclease